MIKLFSKKDKIIDEDLFCNYIRGNKQSKLINIIKKKKINIKNLDLNWNYISENDNLEIEFIRYFRNYIQFNKLSNNKNITSKKISIFAHSLDWVVLSKTYNFTLNELKIFDKYIRWDYLFFYNNNPSNDYKIFFKEKMWWLFFDDNLSIDISKKYHIFNNKILNKNNKNYPDKLINKFNYKLEEYNNNLYILKLILKKQLLKLYYTYEKEEIVTELNNIKCIDLDKNLKNNLYNNVETQYEYVTTTKDMGTQTMNPSVREIEVQTEEIIEEIKDHEK